MKLIQYPPQKRTISIDVIDLNTRSGSENTCKVVNSKQFFIQFPWTYFLFNDERLYLGFGKDKYVNCESIYFPYLPNIYTTGNICITEEASIENFWNSSFYAYYNHHLSWYGLLILKQMIDSSYHDADRYCYQYDHEMYVSLQQLSLEQIYEKMKPFEDYSVFYEYDYCLIDGAKQ